LHVESLARKHDRTAIRSALKLLPTQLDDIYHEALERINRQNSDDVLLAERVLYWISFARRTLKVKEIQCAIAVQNLESDETRIDDEGIPDEDLLVAVCAGLVTIDKENRVIRLVHYTAQQYFERIRETKFPQAQVLITEACLRYLSLDSLKNDVCFTPSKIELLMEMHPLLEYAARCWGYHAVGRPEQLLKDRILEFLAENSRVTNSIQVMMHQYYLFSDLGIAPGENRLWLAAAFGLKEIIKVLLEKGVEIEPRGVKRATALNIAATQGHTAVVQVLLEHDANIETKGVHGETALHNAAEYGHEAIVQLLLDKGADIDIKDDNGQTALFKAAEGGQLAIVRLLLQHGADVQSEYFDDCSPIEAALWAAHYEIFKLLLKSTVNTATMHRYATRALFTAASHGPSIMSSSTFQVLLDQCREGGIPEEVFESAVRMHNGSPAQVTCDNCSASILNTDVHFHCDICNYGDFDLCERCVRNGKHCFSQSHQLGSFKLA